jgi:hypothetical protein
MPSSGDSRDRTSLRRWTPKWGYSRACPETFDNFPVKFNVGRKQMSKSHLGPILTSFGKPDEPGRDIDSSVRSVGRGMLDGIRDRAVISESRHAFALEVAEIGIEAVG